VPHDQRALEGCARPGSNLFRAGQPNGRGGAVVAARIRCKRLTSRDGSFISRALFPFDKPRRVEFYELRLKPHALEEAEPHPPGTTENIVVNSGAVTIAVGNSVHELGQGDALLFVADVAHAYHNRSDSDVIMYLVMTYPETFG